jgi:hypothetical protein
MATLWVLYEKRWSGDIYEEEFPDSTVIFNLVPGAMLALLFGTLFRLRRSVTFT